MDLTPKQQRLDQSLSALGRTLVAYSGGVDSAYLAYAAHQVLGDNMLAVIADSASLARTHRRMQSLLPKSSISLCTSSRPRRWTAQSTSAMTGSGAFTAKMSCSG